MHIVWNSRNTEKTNWAPRVLVLRVWFTELAPHTALVSQFNIWHRRHFLLQSFVNCGQIVKPNERWWCAANKSFYSRGTALAVKGQYKGDICAWREKCQPHPVSSLTEAALSPISVTQVMPTLSQPQLIPFIQTVSLPMCVWEHSWVSGCVFESKVFHDNTRTSMKCVMWVNAGEQVIFIAKVCFQSSCTPIVL